jgi:hypothetical protein
MTDIVLVGIVVWLLLRRRKSASAPREGPNVGAPPKPEAYQYWLSQPDTKNDPRTQFDAEMEARFPASGLPQSIVDVGSGFTKVDPVLWQRLQDIRQNEAIRDGQSRCAVL